MTDPQANPANVAADPLADFASFMLEETSSVELVLPNGEPMLFNGQPVIVHVYGPATEQHKKASAEQEREAAARVFRAMNKPGKKGEKDDPDADAKFLTAVTARFENFPFPGGPAAIYRNPRLLYVHNQVNAHLSNLGNFFEASKTS